MGCAEGRGGQGRNILIVLLDVMVVVLVTFRVGEMLGVNGGGEMMLPLDVVVVVVVAPDAPPSPCASVRGTTAARRRRVILESILFECLGLDRVGEWESALEEEKGEYGRGL